MMKRLTFGRNLSFVGQIAVTAVPIIYTSLLQSPPLLFANLDSIALLVLSFICTLSSFGLAYFILYRVGQSTYSRKLHQPSYILSSTLLFFALSILSTSIGYLVLVYPYTSRIVPTLSDGLAGMVVVSLYVVSLAGVNAITVGSRERRQGKEKLVKQFLDSTAALSDASLDDAKTLSEEIVSSGKEIEENLRKEPMQDTDNLRSRLQEWLTTFNDLTASDQRRMVGWTSNEDNERNEPWKSHFATYSDIRQELSALDLSSDDEVEDGP